MAKTSRRSDPSRVVGKVVGKLSRKGDAEGGGRAQVEVEAGLDERAVLSERHARDVEADAGGGEGERRTRRHVVEGVLPRGRGVRREHHVVPMPDGAEPEAKGRVTDILIIVGAVEGR
jgi:hypothetical protein